MGPGNGESTLLTVNLPSHSDRTRDRIFINVIRSSYLVRGSRHSLCDSLHNPILLPETGAFISLSLFPPLCSVSYNCFKSSNLQTYCNTQTESQAAGYRKRDPSGWVGLLALFLGANVIAGNRAFVAITEDTNRLETDRTRLAREAAALDSSLVQLQERIASLFRGEAAALRGSTFER